VAAYAERLASYPRWPEIASLPDCVACEVPSTARPAGAGAAAGAETAVAAA
jgi:glutathione-regulated potassium-efflux system ancillary protein KefF